MDFNNILNQVLNVAKETFNDTKNGNSTQDKITKVGGGAAAPEAGKGARRPRARWPRSPQ